MATKPPLTIWLVGSNEALQSALEKSGEVNLRVFQEREIVQPQRFAAPPNLVVICREWSPQVEAFTRACGQVSLWLDLLCQTSHSAAAYKSFCQSRGTDGSVLELGAAQLPWVLLLIEAHRQDAGSLLNCVPSRDGQAPVVHSSRLVRAHEIGARIDYLAQKCAGLPALTWYTAISSLATLVFDVVADLKFTTTPILPMYAGQLVDDGTWTVAFHIPLTKGAQARLPQALARLRFDENLRSTIHFEYLSRECGALIVSVGETALELAVLFNPATASANPSFSKQPGLRETLVFRRKSAAGEFTPQNCVYTPFPERGQLLDVPGSGAGSVNWVDDNDSAVGAAASRSNKIFDKAHAQLKKIQTVGSDQSFVAFMKGMDGTGGSGQSRFGSLIELAEKSGTPAQAELVKDLITRYFKIVDEVRRTKRAA